MLGSADTKEDLEGVARECPVLEPGDAFPAGKSKDQLSFGELKARPHGEQGARWQLLCEWHNHSGVLG